MIIYFLKFIKSNYNILCIYFCVFIMSLITIYVPIGVVDFLGNVADYNRYWQQERKIDSVLLSYSSSAIGIITVFSGFSVIFLAFFLFSKKMKKFSIVWLYLLLFVILFSNIISILVCLYHMQIPVYSSTFYKRPAAHL